MNSRERDIVRGLAAAVVAAAADPRQKEKTAAWKRLNSLDPERPMLWITEIPWGEFENGLPELTPVCADEKLRALETDFRRRLFVARRLRCDEVTDGFLQVGRRISGLDYGVEVREQCLAQAGGTHIVSHHYEPVIAGPGDIEKVKMPRVFHDEAATRREAAFYEELLDGVMEVRVGGIRRQWFNAWDQVVRWTGVTEALSDLVCRPGYIHALLRRVTDATLSRLTQLEEQNLLDYPHPVPRVGSGGAGYTDELPAPGGDPGRIRLLDQWGGATAQIFGQVSPAMHEEFALRYENEVMARCGLNYYGCCEALHNRMHLMERVPRLRKISISAWCDVAGAAAAAGRRYVFSHKPSPAILAEDSFDPRRAGQDIRERLERSGGMPCEFIMKDISTVRGDPERVIAWCETAWRVISESR